MCGFVGVVGDRDVAPHAVLALSAIQHRGQDAAGLGTWDQGRLHLHRDVGLIPSALPAEIVGRMPGTAAIAHVRYPTHGLGAGSREEAQPFISRRPGMVLAHNGNVTNASELEAFLRGRGVHLLSASDSELLMLVLGEALEDVQKGAYTPEDLVGALAVLMERARGSYSVCATLEVDGRPTLLAFRDPHGIRPGVYGRTADGLWVVASESVALDVLDAKLVGTVPPGGLVLLRHGEAPIVREIAPRPARRCVFESIYFARPDSVMDGVRVNRVRGRLGQRLASELQERGLSFDVVVPVPDTSRPAAEAISEALGIPNREGFIKNRYSGRTFIMPDPATREAALRLKLNPIDEVFRDRRVLLVDDSIVRGTTMRRIVAMVRRHQPASLHLGIISPPVRHPCFYGIDLPSRAELVAASWPPEQVETALADHLGADSVSFLSDDGLRAVVGDRVCDACFTGRYVVDVSDAERGLILSERRGP